MRIVLPSPIHADDSFFYLKKKKEKQPPLPTILFSQHPTATGPHSGLRSHTAAPRYLGNTPFLLTPSR